MDPGDNFSLDQADFEEVGLNHNAIVAEVFEVAKERSGKKSVLTNLSQISRLVWDTETARSLTAEDQALEDFEARYEALRAHVRRNIGLGKTDSVTLSPDQLHASSILSDAQFEYIEELRRVNVFPYDSLYIENELSVIEDHARRNLGDEANVILVYSATFRYSAYYWSTQGSNWEKELSSQYGKRITDWGEIVLADAAGAVAGAVVEGVGSLGAAAGASLTFGPGGGVMVFTGAALFGAAKWGAGGSIAAAVVGLAD